MGKEGQIIFANFQYYSYEGGIRGWVSKMPENSLRNIWMAL